MIAPFRSILLTLLLTALFFSLSERVNAEEHSRTVSFLEEKSALFWGTSGSKELGRMDQGPHSPEASRELFSLATISTSSSSSSSFRSIELRGEVGGSAKRPEAVITLSAKW